MAIMGFLVWCVTAVLAVGVDTASQVVYQVGSKEKPVYALEGAIAVTRGAIKWLWDAMKMIKAVNEINALARLVLSASGVYSVTAFSGLLCRIWTPARQAL